MSFNSEPIISQLEQECRERGNKYLLRINYNNQNNIMISCPFHNNGQERKPSCGVRKDENVAHCFACGWAGNIQDIISQVLDLSKEDAEQWLNRNFGITDLFQRKQQKKSDKPLISLNRHKEKEISYPGFTQQELESYAYYHPYMYERGLDNKTILECDIGYDKIWNAITFPVYTLDGKPAFIARRLVHTKFFNYPSGVKKPLYLGEKISVGEKELWVCESCLDALIVKKNNKSAVALMGLGSENQIEDLINLRCKSYVLALDNDLRGRKAQDVIYNKLKNVGLVYRAILPEGKKDINDCKDCFELIRKSFY